MYLLLGRFLFLLKKFFIVVVFNELMVEFKEDIVVEKMVIIRILIILCGK